ncbi:MAG: histidine phosphatase family protein [Acidimicrobiales bacterium]|jgi:broad specificity phosphatase PhoE|nr:histidine phosphatase family protein [Acidimicrobiales bacterium]
MELIIVRHGRPQTAVNVEGIANPGLDPTGEWQAERVSEWLAHESIDAVVTSPKARAIETVGPLMGSLGIENEVVADLDEVDRFSSTYYPTEIVHTEGGEYWDKIMAQDWEGLGWDDPMTFKARVEGAWSELLANPRGERVVVACHGGTIRIILGSVAGPDVGFFPISVDYASITRIAVENGKTRFVSLNETGHFDADRIGVCGVMNDGGRVNDAFH